MTCIDQLNNLLGKVEGFPGKHGIVALRNTLRKNIELCTMFKGGEELASKFLKERQAELEKIQAIFEVDEK